MRVNFQETDIFSWQFGDLEESWEWKTRRMDNPNGLFGLSGFTWRKYNNNNKFKLSDVFIVGAAAQTATMTAFFQAGDVGTRVSQVFEHLGRS